MFHEKVVRELEELEDEMTDGGDPNVLDFVKIGEPGIDDDYGLEDLPALLYFAQARKLSNFTRSGSGFASGSEVNADKPETGHMYDYEGSKGSEHMVFCCSLGHNLRKVCCQDLSTSDIMCLTTRDPINVQVHCPCREAGPLRSSAT